MAGETAPLLFTSLNNQFWSTGIQQPTASLLVMILTYAISPYEDWHRQAWAVGLVLLVLMLVANVTARWIISPRAAAEPMSLSSESTLVSAPSSNFPTELSPAAVEPKLKVTNLNFHYGKYQALYDVSLQIVSNRITALIGPSGCGKSTFLRTLNRMHEIMRDTHAAGEVLLDNKTSWPWTWPPCVGGSAWYFRRPTRSLNPFSRSSPMACG